MNKQIFTLMLGVALLSTSSVFAMYGGDLDMYPHTPPNPKIDKSKLEVLNPDAICTLNSEDIEKFYNLKFGGVHEGYVKMLSSEESYLEIMGTLPPKGEDIGNKKGQVYRVDMEKFRATVAYLKNGPIDTHLPQTKSNWEIMQTNKNMGGSTITFAYRGGTYTVDDPWYGHAEQAEKTKDCTLISQEIVLHRVSPSLYY